jgi:hypothetical protein
MKRAKDFNAYHARLNVEYTKINIIAFFRMKQFWRILQRPSIAIDPM